MNIYSLVTIYLQITMIYFVSFVLTSFEFSPLGQVVTLVLSAVPHSMAVERTVSHYNIIRSDKRLSMSLQSTNDRLLIALNGPGTADFDPRPAVAAFFRKKESRHRGNLSCNCTVPDLSSKNSSGTKLLFKLIS